MVPHYRTYILFNLSLSYLIIYLSSNNSDQICVVYQFYILSVSETPTSRPWLPQILSWCITVLLGKRPGQAQHLYGWPVPPPPLRAQGQELHRNRNRNSAILYIRSSCHWMNCPSMLLSAWPGSIIHMLTVPPLPHYPFRPGEGLNKASIDWAICTPTRRTHTRDTGQSSQGFLSFRSCSPSLPRRIEAAEKRSFFCCFWPVHWSLAGGLFIYGCLILYFCLFVCFEE